MIAADAEQILVSEWLPALNVMNHAITWKLRVVVSMSKSHDKYLYYKLSVE